MIYVICPPSHSLALGSGMPRWDATQFAKDLLAGKYNGKVNEALSPLSSEQLKEVIKAVTELRAGKEKTTEEN